MFYKSTRDDSQKITASNAIAKGISEEGGLYVPECFPSIKGRLPELAKLGYLELAEEILSLYLADFTRDEIKDCVEKAYAAEKFSGEPAKLTKINGEEKINMLELWHGPTCAFKDMALQILPHLLTKSLKKNYDGKKAVILVATSGDTGKAALEGFKDVDGTQIIVFYPDNGVSPMQLRQMNTQEGDNVCVCAVEGNFDDCQTQVKYIFTNNEIKERLKENNMMFSSANSINWGRLLPQIIYYVWSYLELYRNGDIKSLDEKINIVVPTGNFGNILAAYYAMQMGISVNKFICASNSNNVLTDFITSGTYDKDRNFYTTNSPSMDILVSSNLERLLFHLCGEKTEVLTTWMNDLSNNGKYSVDKDTYETIKNLFSAGCCDDKETLEEIKTTFNESNYLCDTHTAVALNVYREYAKNTGDTETQTIIASTASPYKFGRDVLKAIGTVEANDEYEIVDSINTISKMPVPQPILNLKDKSSRFDNKCTKDSITKFVLDTIG